MIEAALSISVGVALIGVLIYNRAKQKESKQVLQQMQSLKDENEKRKIIAKVLNEIDLAMQEVEDEYRGQVYTQTLKELTDFTSANLKIRLNRILK